MAARTASAVAALLALCALLIGVWQGAGGGGGGGDGRVLAPAGLVGVIALGVDRG
ncbi:hypothetical protein OG883_30510 [Streptomyces sp. NBC_01142]|uniref:hypothetical protein n=1 Tax=Streptomyces sp. NBC_01142 TaxID=2975865 RepID=UPI0022520D29|nr:hypothetical protein [Streptomyces sp. NBC_01142]MCX4824125.1 hypothetical protein [Streptomyces sp. NBC_01142]